MVYVILIGWVMLGSAGLCVLMEFAMELTTALVLSHRNQQRFSFIHNIDWVERGAQAMGMFAAGLFILPTLVMGYMLGRSVVVWLWTGRWPIR